MKRITFTTLLIISAIMLSSCSMHLGLSSLLHPAAAATKPAKKIKATHTPPAPSSASAAATTAPAAADNTISIKDMAFAPNTFEVAAGTTVTWVNNDTVAHSVTSDTSGEFDSGQIPAGGKFSFTFNKAGTFAYHCSNHSSMTGTITVK